MPFTFRALRAHEHVVREGERVQSCCALLSGFALRYKIIAGGERQITSFCLPGDFVDLQSAFLETATHGLQMMTAGDVALVDRPDLERLLTNHPNLQKAIWTETMVDLSIVSEWVANVGRRDARSRIAHLLCEFATRLRATGVDVQNSFTLPMTQEQIADATGLTAVHVNRTLQELGRTNLIWRKGRTVTVPDWEALVEVADFDPAYLGTSSRSAPSHEMRVQVGTFAR